MLSPLLKQNLALWICSAVTVCTAINAGDRDPYLAASGPTPLQFAVEIPEFNPAWLLPELDMGDGKNAKTEEAKAEAEVKTESVAQVVAEPEKPIEVPVAVDENATEPTQPSTTIEPPKNESAMGPISPQMLLRYFPRGGTNEVLIPYNVEFTPPVRSEPGSGSSAIYISE